ncbi:hypothetical protein [Actinacidiphila bryophytorum]|uniref:hypothetical protein n=1 Tax=Actinacidiphila bryophytorum TaxID=1436133 RepID=UPI002176A43F|nr:hypothetical protein [Actinacidiphila bryophytorum]UWE09675.1 hypothetical protein NYE86_13750 [Actinacidiphila bryophytorum]
MERSRTPVGDRGPAAGRDGRSGGRGTGGGRRSPQVRALAASRLARAHAAAGAEGAFRRAAAEAERQLATAGAQEGPAWLYWLDAAELAAQQGLGLLALGLAEEAAPLLDGALAALDPSFLRDRSLYAARAAQAHARAGDREGALALGREAARLSKQCGSPRLAAALDELKETLDLDGQPDRSADT